MSVTINISQDDITYAQKFLTTYLSDAMPEVNFDEGSGLQDLVIKATSHIFAFFKSELSKVETLRSLAKLQELTEDDETKQAVNDVVSNFFISRGTGAKAQVSITVELSQRTDISLTTDIKFNKDDTHIFYALNPTTVAKEDLIETTNTIGTTVYQTDIILQAENVGTDYEVPPGAFLGWDSFNKYVTRVFNNSAGVSGEDIETNAQYIARVPEAIATRNLINKRSTRTVLLDRFKDFGLKDVSVIGYGDLEMQRDAVNTNVTFDKVDVVHIGGHQDVYVKLPLVENQLFSGTTSALSVLGQATRNGTMELPQVPIYKIHSVIDTDTLAPLSYYIYVTDSKYYFSKYQTAYIILSSGDNNIDITVTYDTVSGFDLINSYLLDPNERIVLANTMAKAKVPIYIELSLNYSQITGQKTFDTAAGKAALLAYIDSLDENTLLNVDSISQIMHTNFGSIIQLHTPIIIKGTIYFPDGTNQPMYTENILTVPEYKALGVTNRVCSYYTTVDYITFNKIG